MARPRAPSFSSAEYWSNRFLTERSFEWLLPSALLVPTILEVFRSILLADYANGNSIDALRDTDWPGPTHEKQDGGRRPYHILHFGCGTSTLGADVQAALDRWFYVVEPDQPSLSYHDLPRANLGPIPQPRVIDADYVASSLPPRDPTSRHPPLVQMDVLDPRSLADHMPRDSQDRPRVWDLLIDKSTADAISTGPSVPFSEDPASESEDGGARSKREVEPVEWLARCLARVTRKGGKWVCVSFSQTRFEGLHDDWGWRLEGQKWVALPSEPSSEQDGQTKVYTPEVGNIIYILKRI